jgi:hypothetical protein
MIHLTQQRFHIVLWETQDRTAGAGMKFQFETLAQAAAAFDEHRRDERYREGILIQWRKASDDWELVDTFRR